MLNLKKHWFIVTTFALLLVTGVFAWGIWQKTSFDQSSRAAVIATIAAVLTSDQYSTLIDSAFNGQLNERPAAEFANYLPAMKRVLGDLNEVTGVYGEAQVPLVNLTAEPIAASYEADLNFTSGPATLKVTLFYTEGRWQISLFLMESQLLLN